MTRVATPRRQAVAVAALVLIATACGDTAPDEPVAVPDDTTVTSATSATSGTSGAECVAVPGDEAAPAATTTNPPTTVLPEGKPAVSIPDELPTELEIADLVEGTGEPAQNGDTVIVHYVGVRSADGTEFDNSYDRGQPIPVTLGAGQVITGWDQGLVGVRVGGQRQLDIPAELAYGDQGAGGVIQPGDALTFVVDVVAITPRVAPVAPPLADPCACPAPDGSAPTQQQFDDYPPFCIDVTTTYTATITTNFGDVVVELLPERAPLTVNSFVVLARSHYFDGTQCHRAIPGFVVQCGDPTATGSGGPGYEFADELPLAGEYEIGSLAMANAGPNTNGSQFFIITGDQGAALPPNYSLFGRVIDGLDTTVVALDGVANPDDNGVPPLQQIDIESITIAES